MTNCQTPRASTRVTFTRDSKTDRKRHLGAGVPLAMEREQTQAMTLMLYPLPIVPVPPLL